MVHSYSPLFHARLFRVAAKYKFDILIHACVLLSFRRCNTLNGIVENPALRPSCGAFDEISASMTLFDLKFFLTIDDIRIDHIKQRPG